MSSQVTVQELLQRNKDLKGSLTPYPTVAEILGSGAIPPKIVIITCVDSRCVPDEFFALGPLDALIIRNICGHPMPNIADIIAADSLFNIENIMIVHHTDCGSLMVNEPSIRENLKSTVTGHDELIDKMSFGAITDVKQSVLDDIKLLKASPLLRKELKDHIHGFVYDIKTTEVSPVDN